MALTHDELVARLQEAGDAYAAREWQRAADLYGELFFEPELVSSDQAIHWNYAMCLAHLGQMELALQHVQAGGYDEAEFRAALGQSDRNLATADYERVVQLYQGQQWAEASEGFAALLLDPGFPASGTREVHWNIAMCEAHRGNWELALEHVAAGNWDVGEFRAACAQSNLDLARHEYAKATALFDEGRWAEACDAFAELLLHPGADASSMGPLHWNMALCFAEMGDVPRAFEHVRAAHMDEQEFRQVLDSRGIAVPDGT